MAPAAKAAAWAAACFSGGPCVCCVSQGLQEGSTGSSEGVPAGVVAVCHVAWRLVALLSWGCGSSGQPVLVGRAVGSWTCALSSAFSGH